MITLAEKTLTYKGVTAIDALSLHVNHGERVALLGKSGSGKSTLIHHLFSLFPESSLIPQELGLVQNLSVYHNVYMGRLEETGTWQNLRNLLFKDTQIHASIRKLLADLELDAYIDHKAGELSGGQKQRVAIARALYRNGGLLLADEPVSALDEHQSRRVMELMTQTFETTIIALHDVDLALTFCDRIIGLKDGKKVLDKASHSITQAEKDLLYQVC